MSDCYNSFNISCIPLCFLLFLCCDTSGYKPDDKWLYISYRELFDFVRRAAKGFISVCTQNSISSREVNICFFSQAVLIYVGPWCLPDPLDLDPLPIDFVLVKRLRHCCCGRSRNLKFVITITINRLIIVGNSAFKAKSVLRVSLCSGRTKSFPHNCPVLLIADLWFSMSDKYACAKECITYNVKYNYNEI